MYSVLVYILEGSSGPRVNSLVTGRTSKAASDSSPQHRQGRIAANFLEKYGKAETERSRLSIAQKWL